MCGIPTVAFLNTGPSDIIDHKITGYLSKYADLEDLIRGLKYVISREWNLKEIAEKTQKKFDTSKIVNSHIDLYTRHHMNQYSNYE